MSCVCSQEGSETKRPEVEIFIPGQFTLLLLWDGTGKKIKRVKIRPEMNSIGLVKKQILSPMAVLFTLQFKSEMFPAT